MSAPDPAEVAVGDELPPLRVHLTRADLVRYAAASGDLNPIHWSDRVATGAGLPGVIAHGMLTMALAGRVLTDWTGDPSSVRSYGTRFTRPVVVPEEGTTLDIEGVWRDEHTLALTVRCQGETVLGNPVAVLRD